MNVRICTKNLIQKTHEVKNLNLKLKHLFVSLLIRIFIPMYVSSSPYIDHFLKPTSIAVSNENCVKNIRLGFDILHVLVLLIQHPYVQNTTSYVDNPKLNCRLQRRSPMTIQTATICSEATTRKTRNRRGSRRRGSPLTTRGRPEVGFKCVILTI